MAGVGAVVEAGIGVGAGWQGKMGGRGGMEQVGVADVGVIGVVAFG